MKGSKQKLFLGLILLLVISILFGISLNGITEVKADSGWDSSYDSSSSWSSSSSWDSDSSWHSSSSSSSHSSRSHRSTCTTEECIRNGRIFAIIYISSFVGLLVLILILTTINNKKHKHRVSTIHRMYNYKQISSEAANSVIPNFDIDEFNFEAYKIFYDVQIAWMDFDYDKLKELLTDELYNTYVMDLDALKLEERQNKMSDFELIETKLTSLREQNGYYIAKVVLEVKFYDYVISTKDNKIVRGNNNTKLDNTYILTFIKTKEDLNENMCPQCGATVEVNATGICEYCKSKLINKTHGWVMSKKEKVDQR